MRPGPHSRKDGSLASAKRRSSRRAHASGAAMFVVSMVLSVLASVGIYALAAAANETTTSGNDRRATQTHYLADYGSLAAAQALSTTYGTNVIYKGGVMAGSPPPCLSLPGVPLTTPTPQVNGCWKGGSVDIVGGAQWATASALVPYNSMPFTAGVPPGSFGTTPVTGDFYVEVTNPEPAAAAPGYSADHPKVWLTTTVWGYVEPVNPATSVLSYEGEGVEIERARVLAGPFQ